MTAVLPGGGWHFEVKMTDGTVYDTPVVGWTVTVAGGLSPAFGPGHLSLPFAVVMLASVAAAVVSASWLAWRSTR